MKNSSKGLLITSLGVLLMSLESLFIKLTNITPLLISFYLGIFMFSATSLSIIAKKELVKIKMNKTMYFTIICSILMAISNIFFISAIKYTTVANTVIILSTAPLFSAFFNYLLYRKKASKNIYIASIFIFIGLFIIFKDQLTIGSIYGNIYAILCAICFSLVFVLLSHHKDINRLVQTSLGGVALSIIAFVLVKDISIELYDLIIVGIMGLLITPLSRVMIGTGTKYISASEVSLLMIIETIMAPIWVWLFLKEIPSSYTFIGGGIILLTLIINSIYTMKRKH